MISLEEAQERILATATILPPEIVPLDKAAGRIAAEPVHSAFDLPPADNSSMDGYAVRSADLAPATPEKPVSLNLIAKIMAGEVFHNVVEPGTCARVFTGAVLPQGADAVVMQEDAKIEGGRVVFVEKIAPWENIRLRGEDVKQKDLIAAAGEMLTPQRISLLAGVGLAKVKVGGSPTVGLLATGDELREAGPALPPGSIFESTRVALAAMSRQAGAVPKIYPLVPDDLTVTKESLQKAFAECDVVVTTGGVSVGEMDWVKSAFTGMGGTLDLWRVALRPGKPFAFGGFEGKLLFGLPGNPVSALVTFFLLARPLLLRMQDAINVQPPVSWAKLGEPLSNSGERRHFMRVTFDANGEARSAGSQASHMLSSMARAEGLVDVPVGASWPAGMLVPVLRWN